MYGVGWMFVMFSEIARGGVFRMLEISEHSVNAGKQKN